MSYYYYINSTTPGNTIMTTATIQQVRAAASELIGGQCLMTQSDAEEYAEKEGRDFALGVIAKIRRDATNPNHILYRFR